MTAVAMTTTGPGHQGPAPLVSQPPSKLEQRPLHAGARDTDQNALSSDSSQQAARRHQQPAAKTTKTSAQSQIQGRRRPSSFLAAKNNNIARPHSNSKKPSLKHNHSSSRGSSNGLITIPTLGKAAFDTRPGIPVPPAIRMAKETVPRATAAIAGSAPTQSREPIGSPRSPTGLGRSGRQFTVGNIGHNGLLYLRPVIRPASELQRQRQPVYPLDDVIPPPDRPFPAGGHRRRNSSIGHESVMSSILSYRRPQDLQRHRNSSELSYPPSQSGRPSHVRAHSFSTMDERINGQDTFKVVIRSASQRHPRTARTSEDTDAPDEIPNVPLQVNIPSFRLGKPHFGVRGSAAIRSTAYTRDSTEQAKSPDFAQAEVESAPSSYITLPDDLPAPLKIQAESEEVLVPRPQALPPSPRISLTEFAMHVFDDLSYNPDDSSVVRFSPVTNDIIAATPSRLIAHITSPNFLDYELLSDFFLTFRGFMLPSDLVSFLLARLRWAVERIDDFGRIVRVRTFVALRHWILNYFADPLCLYLHLSAERGVD